MSFETPKGKMTFRAQDHQAMQSMYHFKIKVDPAFAWGVPELVREIKPRRWPFPSATSAEARAVVLGVVRPDPDDPASAATSGRRCAVSCRFEPGTLTAIVGPTARARPPTST